VNAELALQALHRLTDTPNRGINLVRHPSGLDSHNLKRVCFWHRGVDALMFREDARSVTDHRPPGTDKGRDQRWACPVDGERKRSSAAPKCDKHGKVMRRLP